MLSLDLELMWGVYGTHSIASYGQNILGARQAVPAMLDLFEAQGISATWACVGLLMFENRAALRAALPYRRPQFSNARDDSYAFVDAVGPDEASDPYHFGLSLVREIADRPHQELATHTFSHFYCLEDQLDVPAFAADIDAAIAAFEPVNVRPRSIVFPRNQVTRDALAVCAARGIDVYRGPGPFRMDRPAGRAQQSTWRRGMRLANSYVPLCGPAVVDVAHEGDVINIPASRFLRPFSGGAMAPARMHIGLIKREMAQAARQNRMFHLWFHPHNFGTCTDENLALLAEIITFWRSLHDRFGWPSRTMAQAADAARNTATQMPGAA
ncbi:polysaccharide deacetylase family protein [uncultured Tateyamaria sp.]|uniref:polysaccharide deacetylase family protein n=1 Tax=uncultured Tateyamaria sp. TaxID=455651 RepID=UPI0026070E73|nr:polysaccharide deacetylase family protein [uncultured Tateyamaria sp.]